MPLTVNDVLAKMASDFGIPNLSIAASPVNNTQGIRYLNVAQLDVVRNLCPVRLRGGEFSLGRLDKLTRLTETEDESDAPVAGNDPHKMPLPGDNGIPIHYFKISLSTNSGSYYPCLERSYAYVYSHRGGQTYAATASNPLFCWGDGAIYVVPNGTTAQVARYHFIEKPSDLAVDGNWALDEDLAIPTLDLSLALAWGQVPGQTATQRIREHLTRYFETMNFYNPVEIVKVEEGS